MRLIIGATTKNDTISCPIGLPTIRILSSKSRHGPNAKIWPIWKNSSTISLIGEEKVSFYATHKPRIHPADLQDILNIRFTIILLSPLSLSLSLSLSLFPLSLSLPLPSLSPSLSLYYSNSLHTQRNSGMLKQKLLALLARMNGSANCTCDMS